MTTLQQIQDFLDIEIGDKRLRPGKKCKNKNKYYYYEDQYYIVMLTHGKWMIAEDCKKTRKLLRLHYWHYNDGGYGQTNQGKTTKKWHQYFLQYEKGLVCDHINRKRFDNRSDNLRIVTVKQNNENRIIQKNNTSGVTGVRLYIQKKNGSRYWMARITDDNRSRLSASFAVNVYGEEEAKQLAIEWRRQKEQEFGYLGD